MLIMLCWSSSSEGQNKYPYRKVINGDTITLIDQAQVQKINLTFIALAECDSLHKIGKAMLEDKLREVEKWTKIVQKQDTVIKNDSIIHLKLWQDNTTLINTVEDNKKQVKRLRTRLTVSAIFNGITTLGAIIATWIAIK